jgi:lipopolysaccharide transport system ATP-binding protein
VVPRYLASGFAESASEREWTDIESAPGNELVRIEALRVSSGNAGEPLIGMDTPVNVELAYRRMIPDRVFHLEIHVINHEEVTLFYASPGLCPPELGRYVSRCTIPPNLLNSGGYRIKLMLVEDESRAIWLDDATTAFSVDDLGEREAGWMARRPGVIYPHLEWQTRVMAGGAQ